MSEEVTNVLVFESIFWRFRIILQKISVFEFMTGQCSCLCGCMYLKSLVCFVQKTAALAQKNSEATRVLVAQQEILEKELGEIQKVLLAMQVFIY